MLYLQPSIVLATARAATPSDTDKADPPLKPTHPNQRRQPPRMTKGTLVGPRSWRKCGEGSQTIMTISSLSTCAFYILSQAVRQSSWHLMLFGGVSQRSPQHSCPAFLSSIPVKFKATPDFPHVDCLAVSEMSCARVSVASLNT